MRSSLKIIVLGAILIFLPQQSFAASSSVLCLSKGKIVVKAKCARKEKRLSINDIAATALQPVPGPQGAAGADSRFSFNSCYGRVFSTIHVSGDEPQSVTLECTLPDEEFVLDANYTAVGLVTATSRPFLRSRSYVVHPTFKRPQGVRLEFQQSIVGGTDYTIDDLSLLCCKR